MMKLCVILYLDYVADTDTIFVLYVSALIDCKHV